jgi:flagellar basal body-associated protein FliL
MEKNTNSGYIPSFVKNDSINNKSDKIKKIIIIILICILICIIIYLLIIIINFYQKECYEKKTLYNYLFDFSNSDICIQETEPPPIIKKESSQPMPAVKQSANTL